MLTLLLLGLDLPRGELWNSHLIGLMTAVLVVLVGCFLLGRDQDGWEDSSVSRPGFRGRERRRRPRRLGNLVEVQVCQAEGTGGARGWVMNYSQGGLCLSLPEGVPSGTFLSLRKAQTPDGAPWTRLEVRHCRARDDEWEVGGRFVGRPLALTNLPPTSSARGDSGEM
jgi:hypothetical protein